MAFAIIVEMKIHITHTNDSIGTGHFGDVLSSYKRSNEVRHELTDDAAEADLILVVAHLPSLAAVRQVEVLRRFPEKALVYSEIDPIITFASGVYGSCPRRGWLNGIRTRSFAYLSGQSTVRNKEVYPRPGTPKDLLFSFRGRSCCTVRFNLFAHDFKRADVLVQDTTDYAHWNEESKMSKAQAQRDYAEIIARSHFALSPRGAGFGSIRLFEVMEMGVAPVLLSDRYALPKGPDWDGFLIRVREADYARLPEILEARVAESEERGRKARQAWETFFAPEVAFNRLIEQLVEIRQSRGVPEKLMQKLWPMMQASADARAGLASTVRAAIAAPRRLLRGTR